MPVLPYATLHWFNKRLRRVIPESEGIIHLNRKNEIHGVLEAVLQQPLAYSAEKDGLPSDVLWWFRGGASNYIQSYTLTADNVLTIHMRDYERRMAVVEVDVMLSDVLDLNFLYLRCDPLPAISSPEQISEMVAADGYAWDVEYYLPSSGRTMQYQDFDADAPYADEAIEVHIQVSPYNVFIAPKESRLNARGDNALVFGQICNLMLKGEAELSVVVKVLANCPPSDYTQNLVRQFKRKK